MKSKNHNSPLHIDAERPNSNSSSLEFFRTLFTEMPYEIHIWKLVRDENGEIKTWRLIDANRSALRTWNKKLSDVLNKTTDEIFPGANAVNTFMPTIKKIFSEKKSLQWKSYFAGTDQTLQMVSIPFGELFVSSGVDVSDIIRASNELKDSQQRLTLATETAKIGVWEFDLESKTLCWDESMYKIYGVEPSDAELPYETWSKCVHEDDIETATRELNECINYKKQFDTDFRIVSQSEQTVKHLVARASFHEGDHNHPAKIIGVNIDVTEQKEAEQQIQHLAYHDALTGIANRSMLNERLSQSIALSERTGVFNALIFIDIDNFKQLNDSAGHSIGDELLVNVAKRLFLHIRRGDTLARFGGDEFTIILNNLDKELFNAERLANKFALKMIELINEPFELSSGFQQTTASLGISVFNGDSSSSDIMRQADLAMYKSKELGRNQTCFFDPVMQNRIVQRVAMEKDLLAAIENEDLEVHYQIQMHDDGSLRGAEALLRWPHPDKGYISPQEFIPIAEETGYIKQLGRWVFKRVLNDFSNSIRPLVDGTFVMSLNVSALQLYEDNFVNIVAEDLREESIDASRIKLEITESVLINNSPATLEKMLALKKIGFQFSLDDFGTGYSSLSRLKQLPIDELKIDRSFVSDVLYDEYSKAITQSVIALAGSLGLSVIAEGIETEEQKTSLKSMGCTAYQGFLFSKPIPLDEFTLLIKSVTT